MRIVLLTALIGALTVGAARGQFLKIDDFESYSPGAIDGQTNGDGTWVADSTFEVAFEPGTSNKVFNMPSDPDSMNASNNYPDLELDEGESGTLYFRFQRGGEGSHIIFGLSPADDPLDFGDFEASISARTNAEPGRLQARSGGNYVTIQDFFELDEWINIWLVIDNDLDQFQVYAQSEVTFPDQQLLDDNGNDIFLFRNGTFDPLTTFFVRTGTLHEGPFYFDDIYFDPDGENLELPTEVPSGVGPFRRGDCNGDGSINITDGVTLLGFIFAGEAAPPCLAACDFNRGGSLNITTAVYVFNFLFSGGDAIPDPTAACGFSPEQSDMDLGCENISQGCM